MQCWCEKSESTSYLINTHIILWCDLTIWICVYLHQVNSSLQLFRNVSKVFSVFANLLNNSTNPTRSHSNWEAYHHCIQRQCQLHAQPACWKWPVAEILPNPKACNGNASLDIPWQPGGLSTRQLSQRGHLGTEAPLSSPRPAPNEMVMENSEKNLFLNLDISNPNTQRITKSKFFFRL